MRDPAAERAGKAVVDERGDQDAKDDGKGLAIARGQHQRQQLRLVAHFSERDDACGDEEGFHVFLWDNRAAMHREMPMTHTFPGPARKVWSSVSPGMDAAWAGLARRVRSCARHNRKRSSLLTYAPVPRSPHCAARWEQGGYSPMEAIIITVAAVGRPPPPEAGMAIRPAPARSRWSGGRGNRSSTAP
ncbi:hypothetical protein D3C81_1662220 [compost metagenome]